MRLLLLFPLFIFNKRHFELNTASKIDWEALRNNHMIYVGSFRYMGRFKQFFSVLPVDYIRESNRRVLIVKDQRGEPIKEFQSERERGQNYEKDYTIIAKMHGPGENTFLFFVSFHHIGVTEAVKRMTARAFLEFLSQQYLPENGLDPAHDDFFMIMEVEGYNKIGFTVEICHLQKIEPAN